MKNLLKRFLDLCYLLLEILKTCFQILYGFKHKPSSTKKNKNKNKNKIAIILGNGPSLRNDLNEIAHASKDDLIDVWCVNFFANTNEYVTIKPNNYVIADPGFWEENISKEMLVIRDILLKRLKLVTDWDITVHLPSAAKGTYLCQQITKNNIKINFFNSTVVSLRPNKILFWLYTKQLAMPKCQNVLVPTIFLSILSEYKKIGIFGADHSWHRDILVKESIVMLNDNHFYDEEVNLTPFYKNKFETFTMAEIFSIWGLVFRQYEILSAFGKSNNLKILNCSSFSFIDAFETGSLSKLLLK